MNNAWYKLLAAVVVLTATFLFGYYKGTQKEKPIIPPTEVECIVCDSLQLLLDKERMYGDSLQKLLDVPYTEPKNKPGTYKDSTTETKLDRIIGLK